MLSILIPTYNYDIFHLVETIWNQCSKESYPFEIIVVDDCSTKTEILEQNNRIGRLTNCSIISNKENLGRTASRNLLASLATHNWLLFLDADVLPSSDNFIKNFRIEESNDWDVIFGGISYCNTAPKRENILRWVYGKAREAKSVSERLKDPFFIISQNLLIRKEIFSKANSIIKNAYGLDNLFSNNLKKLNVAINHINNPVYHLGLESASVFIKKSLESVETTVNLEAQNLMDSNLRPLQKSYLKLKKYYFVKPFSVLMNLTDKQILNNLGSKRPSLFLFDLYRLNYYIKLKDDA